jgi:hypothetical protein
MFPEIQLPSIPGSVVDVSMVPMLSSINLSASSADGYGLPNSNSDRNLLYLYCTIIWFSRKVRFWVPSSSTFERKSFSACKFPFRKFESNWHNCWVSYQTYKSSILLNFITLIGGPKLEVRHRQPINWLQLVLEISAISKTPPTVKVLLFVMLFGRHRRLIVIVILVSLPLLISF